MMQTYTIYNVATGEITGGIETRNFNTVALNTPEGHAAILGASFNGTHRVVDGVIVDKPTSEVDATLAISAYQGLREERNIRLSGTDWTQVPDSPVDSAVWAEYRQVLRDLPEDVSDVFNIVWPTRPQY